MIYNNNKPLEPFRWYRKTDINSMNKNIIIGNINNHNVINHKAITRDSIFYINIGGEVHQCRFTKLISHFCTEYRPCCVNVVPNGFSPYSSKFEYELDIAGYGKVSSHGYALTNSIPNIFTSIDGLLKNDRTNSLQNCIVDMREIIQEQPFFEDWTDNFDCMGIRVISCFAWKWNTKELKAMRKKIPHYMCYDLFNEKIVNECGKDIDIKLYSTREECSADNYIKVFTF